MSADERNDTIAQLSLATYPYPGEKSKKHKEIQIMKRYLSLALALILALSVFCGVSVFAEDAEVNRIPPTCVHLWDDENSYYYGDWTVYSCTQDVRHMYRVVRCALCGARDDKIHSSEYRSADNHDYVYISHTQVNGTMRDVYVCSKCNKTKYV